MNVTLDSRATDAMRAYQEHKTLMVQASDDKERALEIEQCRSYAVDFTVAILNAIPRAKRVRLMAGLPAQPHTSETGISDMLNMNAGMSFDEMKRRRAATQPHAEDEQL